MIQLILKDILLQKKRLLYFPVLYNIFIIIVLQEYLASFLVAGIVVSYIMLQTAVVYEDMNKSEIIINSLPIKKKKIILARYLSVFVYLVISIVIYLIVSSLFVLLHLPFKVQPVTISGVVTIIMSLGMLVSIYLPVFYKYGYIKAKLFHILFIMAAFSLPTTIVNIFKDSPDAAVVKYINMFINGLSTGEFSFIILLFTILVMSLSIYISVKFYKKREF